MSLESLLEKFEASGCPMFKYMNVSASQEWIGMVFKFLGNAIKKFVIFSDIVTLTPILPRLKVT